MRVRGAGGCSFTARYLEVSCAAGHGRQGRLPDAYLDPDLDANETLGIRVAVIRLAAPRAGAAAPGCPETIVCWLYYGMWAWPGM